MLHNNGEIKRKSVLQRNPWVRFQCLKLLLTSTIVHLSEKMAYNILINISTIRFVLTKGKFTYIQNDISTNIPAYKAHNDSLQAHNIICLFIFLWGFIVVMHTWKWMSIQSWTMEIHALGSSNNWRSLEISLLALYLSICI